MRGRGKLFAESVYGRERERERERDQRERENIGFANETL
jgi:hypothetical protein